MPTSIVQNTKSHLPVSLDNANSSKQGCLTSHTSQLVRPQTLSSNSEHIPVSILTNYTEMFL